MRIKLTGLRPGHVHKVKREREREKGGGDIIYHMYIHKFLLGRKGVRGHRSKENTL